MTDLSVTATMEKLFKAIHVIRLALVYTENMDLSSISLERFRSRTFPIRNAWKNIAEQTQRLYR